MVVALDQNIAGFGCFVSRSRVIGVAIQRFRERGGTKRVRTGGDRGGTARTIH